MSSDGYFDYASLDGSTRANIISFLDRKSRCAFEQVSKIVRLDVYSVYFDELPIQIQNSFRATDPDLVSQISECMNDETGECPRTTTFKRLANAAGSIGLPVLTNLAGSPDASRIWDPVDRIRPIVPHYAWKCISPFVASLCRNELQRIRKWWICFELTKRPQYKLMHPSHFGFHAQERNLHSSMMSSTPTLTKCSVCLDFTLITGRNRHCPYIIVCDECSETMTFKYEQLLKVWRFTPEQIDDSFPYIDTPIPTLTNTSSTSTEEHKEHPSYTEGNGSITTSTNTTSTSHLQVPGGGSTNGGGSTSATNSTHTSPRLMYRSTSPRNDPMDISYTSTSPSSLSSSSATAAAAGQPPQVNPHLFDVPANITKSRIYLFWDLVPIRLLSPLYTPRGAHVTKDIPRTVVELPKPTKFFIPQKKRRLFGAARASVLAAEERQKKLKQEQMAGLLDADSMHSNTDTPTNEDRLGKPDVALNANTTFCVVPRPCKSLQSKIDSYRSLPLMIYRRYVQCHCGFYSQCPESHTHWEEDSSIWPQGTCLRKVEMALLKAHELRALIQICEYETIPNTLTDSTANTDASTTNTSNTTASANSSGSLDDLRASTATPPSSAPYISQLFPVHCRLSLPDSYDPLVITNGINLPRFNTVTNEYIHGELVTPEQQLPTKIAVAYGLLRIRQHENIEESVALCSMSNGGSCTRLSATGGACGVVHSIFQKSDTILAYTNGLSAARLHKVEAYRDVDESSANTSTNISPISRATTPMIDLEPLPNTLLGKSAGTAAIETVEESPSPCLATHLHVFSLSGPSSSASDSQEDLLNTNTNTTTLNHIDTNTNSTSTSTVHTLALPQESFIL